jgi:hypothetical protein
MLRPVLRNGASTLLELGRPAEALEWIGQLERLPGSSGMAGYLAGIAHLALGDAEGALRSMQGVTGDVVDEDGLIIPGTAIAMHRAVALVGEERWADAAAVMRALVEDPRCKAPVWGPLIAATHRADQDLSELAALASTDKLTSILGQALNAPPAAAHVFAGALWAKFPTAAPLLAFAAVSGHTAGLEPAMEWSARLRQAGLPLRCPLVTLAQSVDAEWIERLRAAAVVSGGFSDDRGPGLVAELAREIPVVLLPVALQEVAVLAPVVLGTFVEAAAVAPERCLVLAECLHDLGAPDEALAVFEHGWAQPGPRDDAMVGQAAAWLRHAGHPERAQALAS